MTGLVRTLGPTGAIGIGAASMVGAGVFYVWAPAAALAGSWLLVSLMIAGSVALVNAVTMAQLALHNPVSGGAYQFGRKYVSPRAGFLAGWMFLTGKTASAAAIAVIAARYLAPDYATILAVGLLAVFALANLSGLRTTAGMSIAIVALVVAMLVAIIFHSGFAGGNAETSHFGGVYGVAQAAGLMFFAFAGYARMATLGEEVRSPTVVLPRVIVGTLVGVLVLYAVLGAALIGNLGVGALATSVAPIADLATDSWRVVVISFASLASLGSLAAILAGLSRTSMAMARQGDLPIFLARVWPRTSSPAAAEITMAIIAIVLAVLVDPVWLVGASSSAVLSYYAIAHLSAIGQPERERLIPRVVPWVGLVACVALVATLPRESIAVGGVSAALGLTIWGRVERRRRNHS